METMGNVRGDGVVSGTIVTIKPMRQRLWFAAGCLVCAAVCWKSFLIFEGTEFGSGSLAGNQVLAALTYVFGLLLNFKYPKAASISALLASFFSLPLYLYLVFPNTFRQVWSGQWSVPYSPGERFVWDGWWITGIFVTIPVAFICVLQLTRNLRVVEPRVLDPERMKGTDDIS